MTININEWLNLAIEKLQKAFQERLLFVGLQGSYNRGEASSESDIDLVVIVDEMSFQDLKDYREMIGKMPHKELACGFISGKKELQNWSKADLFQFFYDTRSLIGNLQDIIQPPSIADIKKSIKTSSETLYHMAVHSFVHSAQYREDLQNLYKMTFFILQARYFVENNRYIKTKNELAERLQGLDREIMTTCIKRKELSSANKIECENLYKQLIDWTAKNI